MFESNIVWDDHYTDPVNNPGDQFAFDSSPFNEYKNFFNVYSIFEASDNAVGCTSHVYDPNGPGTAFIDCGSGLITAANPTEWGCTMDHGNLHRFILPTDPGDVVDRVQDDGFNEDDTSPLVILILAKVGVPPQGIFYTYAGGTKMDARPELV